jgi:hypothetical protein
LVVACFGTVVTVARVLRHCRLHSCLHHKKVGPQALAKAWRGLLLLAAVAASLDVLILHLACNSNLLVEESSVHIKALLSVLLFESSSM